MGGLAHTCIAEEGTPVHPAALASRLVRADSGAKEDD